jgi:hypothetical protein
MSAQQTIELAAKLYGARDATRLLHGDKYAARMQECGTILREVMAAKNVNEIRAAMMMCEQTGSAYQQMDILAAVVELIEPSGVMA